MKPSQRFKPADHLAAAIGALSRTNPIQPEMSRWRAKQRHMRPILGRHRSGGRFLL